MKHVEIIQLNYKLSQVKGLRGNDINYAIKKNLSKLKPELEIYTEQEKDILVIKKPFDDAVLELQKAFIGKKEDEISEWEKTKFAAEVDVLKETYKNILKEAQDKWDELVKFRNERDSTFEIFTVKKHHVPADISTEDMDLIFDIIRDND